MTEPTKKIKNPLFSTAVTGSTFEDFAQNAVLLPAKEKPPPVQNVLPEQPTVVQEPSISTFETIPTTFDQFQNQQPFDLTQQENYPQQYDYFNLQQTQPVNLNPPPIEQQQSNLSSVFSSFSSILKLKSSPQTYQQVDDSVPPPAGIETLISQDTTNAEPVPLFPPTGIDIFANNSPKPTPPQGPVNTFRRSGLKRPVYAQVPGLSTSIQPPPIQNLQPNPQVLPPQPVIVAPQHAAATFFQPISDTPSSSILSEFISTPNTNSPALSVTSTQDNSTPTTYFKPISPQPMTFWNPASQQSLPVFTPTTISTQSNLLSQSNFQSPVMSAIPANEVLQDSNMNIANNLASSYNGDSIATGSVTNQIYRPVYHHWFHKKEIEGKVVWQPFSMVDSLALDGAFTSNDLDPDKVVATDGGRYDVNILRRQRVPVYWKGAVTEVRRCSWFHKGNSNGFVPYEENIATKLEEEFKTAFELNQWHRKVEFPSGEVVVFRAPDSLVLYPPSQSPDPWGNSSNQVRTKVVKRGMDEFDIDEGEPAKVDHLLFLVHGIGSVCDLKFRTVEEVVDEFRSISLQLVQSHYKSSSERGVANRIEVLPISWHEELHSEDTGIDRKLKSITLESVPRLRDFTNDALVDILFYTSPIYCQTIMSTVGNQLNNTLEMFKKRNPDFDGGVSLGGHSLGSLILFDLLCHQHPEPERLDSDTGSEDVITALNEGKPPPAQRKMSRRISYMMGAIGTGQPQIHYPHLNFQPKTFFALGSPIGMFVTVRGLDNLGERFALPTCPSFFNIFHPYDPVAYRIESLINPELTSLKPSLIPHHKGRKRMHLELKETMARVGADLKQRVIESMKSTWNSFYQLAMFHRQDQPSLEEQVDKAIKEELIKEDEDFRTEEPEQQQTDLPLGLLNQNRRIDYVLQEAPFEFFNDYLFALTSHVCYWESEDTMLLILKEIYSSMNVAADDKIPQQSMTIERPPSSPSAGRSPNNSVSSTDQSIGMDPTAAVQQSVNIGPPPMSGFVKKT